MKEIIWFLALLLCWVATCTAQLNGHFYLDKEVYAPGEPVFLSFTVRNDGVGPQKTLSTNPYSFCSGYRIRLSSDAEPGSVCETGGFGGSCLLSEALLQPGEGRTDRILLNFGHDLREPGAYDIDAYRLLPFGDPKDLLYGPTRKSIELRNELHFQIDPHLKLDPHLLQDLADQLQSKDLLIRLEAARTLAALGPLALEETLLGFANNGEFRQFAPLAFHNLNTQRSMDAMVRLLIGSSRGSIENLESARYLGESGNPRWFPVLLELAKKYPSSGEYVYPAAETGGARAVPFLSQLTVSTDKDTVSVAISGLAYTGSRTAIPILLKLLNTTNRDNSGRAAYGLRRLTHMRVGTINWPEDPQSEYSQWEKWWRQSSQTARIYKATECGDYQSLP